MAEPTVDEVARVTRIALSLLPPGRGLGRGIASLIYALTEGYSTEFARAMKRGEELLAEADPTTTSEMLADWERVLGLPDECSAGETSDTLRRAAIVARLTDTGETTIAAFLRDALALDYADAAISRPAYNVARCDSPCDAMVGDESFRFLTKLTATSHGTTADAQLECTLDRKVQLHGRMIYEFTGGLTGDFDVAESAA
jgi:uncharacterized protein YmfQ (DUF2313 family)